MADEGRADERDQAEERLSTEGVGFKQALQHVLAGGRGDEEVPPGEQGGAVPETTTTDDLTDEELFARLQSAQAGLEDGTLPMFYDAESAKRYMRER